MKPIVYYSQNREDLIIASFFADVKDGFYVDVGAHHPTQDSVTKYFYNKGWCGINIEPQKDLYAKLRSSRKRDINIQMGVAAEKGKLTLRKYKKSSGLSTFSPAIHKDNEEEGLEYKEYEVDVNRLDSIFEGNNVKEIHFLKIDVEGFEYEVVSSNNWDKYRPKVVCIESNHITRDWHELFKKFDYKQVFYDGLNEYFLANEESHRLNMFKEEFPNLLVSSPIISYGWKKHIDRLSSQLEKVQNSLDQSQNSARRLQEHILKLEQELRMHNSIKFLLKKIAIKLRNKIASILK